MFNWAASITRRCFLWITGGLIVKSAPMPRAPVVTAETPLSPETVLARMAEVYAQCHSYCDLGCVTSRFLTPEGNLQWVTELHFSTAFVRPNGFRFEFKSHHPKRTEWHRYLVWAELEDVRTWWDLRPGVNRDKSLALALAAATGVSSGSAHTIPRLLMPDRIRGRKLTELAELRLLEDADTDGIRCYRIQGRIVIDPAQNELHRSKVFELTGRLPEDVEHSPRMLWIEKGTYLLRRIEQHKRFSTFQTEDVTTYASQVDIPIAAEQLRFDPPVENEA